MQLKHLKTRAFSLIELLVVIGIIAILSAIIYPTFGSSRAKARDAQRVSDLGQLQLAIQLFYDRCGAFPAASFGLPNGLNYLMTISTNSNCPTGITLGTFMSTVPVPPAGAGQTFYDYMTTGANSNPDNYILHAALESYNPAVAKGLPGIPTGYNNNGLWSCSNTVSSVHYCITSN
ncbi:MAG: type II secretion system protein [Candidatus Taylorbacteria bacterium]|nr:type II secretion system protein [Candidatus Taylorbacteria bacterium]